VEGRVLDTAGASVTGATVTINGAGWSRAIMTDDGGKYGFAGLCEGTVTLQAFTPGGQSSPVASVSLNGQDPVWLDLSLGSSPAASTATGLAATGTATHPPATTPEAEMPVTGFSGWLLAGGAALGALLLISAGARRALLVREHTHGDE
jgi:hypothetical protein